MKRVTIVAIVLTLMLSASGCRVMQKFGSRGAACNSTGQPVCASSAGLPGAIPSSTSYYGSAECDNCNGGSVVGGSMPMSSGAISGGQIVEGQIINGQMMGGPIQGLPMQGAPVHGGVLATPMEGQVYGGTIDGMPLGSNFNMAAPENGFFSHVVSDRKISATNDKLPGEDPLPSAKKVTSQTTNK